MTFNARVEALQPLGFTPRQTRFLVTVALHSGFCLRRQYAAFAQVGYGAMVREFLDALVRRDLARRITYRRHRGFLYHLHARGLYRAIGQEDNRNRRATSPALIARKLMLLDLAISEPEATWYVTEADKVALCTDQLRVPRSVLPQRRYAGTSAEAGDTSRYFPHKLPIYLAGDSPTPHVVWLETTAGDQGCVSFLRDHGPLLAHLPAWTFVAVAPATAPNLTACAQAFRRVVEGGGLAWGLEGPELAWYCRTRRAHEQRQFAALSVGDIARFRDLQARVAGPAIDEVYARWRTGGDDAIASRSGSRGGVDPAAGRFVARVLPHTYSQFGDLPGVC